MSWTGWVWLIAAGFFVGVTVGVLIGALLAVAGQEYRERTELLP